MGGGECLLRALAGLLPASGVAVFGTSMVTRYQQSHFAQSLQAIQVSDDEVAAFYQSHAQEFAVPPRYQAAIVAIEVPKTATPEAREKARQRAEEALAAAHALDASVHHFGEVASKYSDDRASRYQGGVIGWLIQYQGEHYKWDQKVLDAVFSLKPGQIGPIVETDHGFYLVRLVDRQEAAARPLAALADGIRQRLLRDKRRAMEDQLYQQLYSDVGVKVDEALLTTIESPQPQKAAPPALPTGP